MTCPTFVNAFTFFCCFFVVCLTYASGNPKFPLKKKKKNPKIPVINFQLACYEHNILKESSELEENSEETAVGPIFAQNRLHSRKLRSGGCLDRSSGIPSPRQTSIDRTNDCVTNSERSALVIGAPTHPRVTGSHNGRWHAAGAIQAYDEKKTIGRWRAQNR